MEFSDYIDSSIDADIIHLELQRGYRYYRNLTPDLKERFVQRTSAFIEQKKFVGRQGLEITDTMRIIVSACAIQVTFGLQSFALDTFKFILIYPDVYESPVTKQMHKGETNIKGFICLSWKDIVAGIENPTDNYNLGLHEWTHALRFNSINFEETDYFFDNYINKWVSSSMVEFNKLKSGKLSIFRRYGATNIHEFLSVCTEHFFESPDEFKSNAPDFFNQMCILFNQLPANDGSVKINVRNALLIEPLSQYGKQQPVLELKANLFWTLLNGSFVLHILYSFMFFLILGLCTTHLLSGFLTMLTMLIVLIIAATIILNYNFVTVRFYDIGIYIQKGFTSKYLTKFYVNYHALTKVEINKGVDSYYYSRNVINKGQNSNIIKLFYYDGVHFLNKSVKSSAIRVPHQEIIDLLEKKQVPIWYPKG